MNASVASADEPVAPLLPQPPRPPKVHADGAHDTAAGHPRSCNSFVDERSAELPPDDPPLEAAIRITSPNDEMFSNLPWP